MINTSVKLLPTSRRALELYTAPQTVFDDSKNECVNSDSQGKLLRHKNQDHRKNKTPTMKRPLIVIIIRWSWIRAGVVWFHNRRLPGAVMGCPARDEVMKKILGRQGRPGPHPWRGHEEKTWQARPSRIRDPPGWPRPLPHPVSSPLISAVVLVCPATGSCVPAKSSPAPLSLNKDQLKS